MDNTSKIFVKVISNYINGLPCDDVDFSDIDWERFGELIIIHNVGGIFYSKLKNYDLNKKYMQGLEMRFYSELALFQRRNIALNSLKKVFNENNLNHICVKGVQIAPLYPNPELRTMGDMDILIEKEDRERSHELLLKDGAEYVPEESNELVWAYKYKNCCFEIHTNLVSDNITMNGIDFKEYFAVASKHKKQENNCTFVLEDEYNIVYTIFHIAKHFYSSGCGIRMLMDLPMLIRNSKESLSWDYIWKEFDKLKLTGFASKIFMLCEEWFGEFGVKYSKKVKFENIETIEEYILSGGVFGHYGRNTDADQIKNHGNKEEGGFNYFTGMIRWAFPSCSDMRQCSEWFRNKPAILLPIAYVERFMRNAKERGGIIKWSKNILSGKNDLKEKTEIHSIMDLK